MRLPIVHVDEACFKSLSYVCHTPKVVEQSKKYIAPKGFLRVTTKCNKIFSIPTPAALTEINKFSFQVCFSAEFSYGSNGVISFKVGSRKSKL